MRARGFDYLMWTAIAAVSLLLIAVIAAGDRVGARLLTTEPLEGGVLAARGKIGLTFSEPMQLESVAAHFWIEPEVPGGFEAAGNQVWFVPSQPFALNVTYTAWLEAGAEAGNGRRLLDTQQWRFTTRPPDIVFVSRLVVGQTGLWRTAPQPAGAQALALLPADTQTLIYDYAVAPDSSRIVYSSVNDWGGVDIWALRPGGLPQLLIDCGLDRCSEPAWSPDSTQVAYLRQAFQSEFGSGYGASRVWTAQVGSGETSALFQDSQVLAYRPTWSPDGRRLAFYDAGAGSIRVVDLPSGDSVLLPSRLGLVGTWSPDGQQMLYPEAVLTDGQLYETQFFLAAVDTGAITGPVVFNLPGQDFGIPEWSPTGEWLVMSTRLDEASLGRQLWLVRPDGQAARAITQDDTFTHSNYQWDPWGQTVVFERMALSGATRAVEIITWDLASGETMLVARDGFLPKWLP